MSCAHHIGTITRQTSDSLQIQLDACYFLHSRSCMPLITTAEAPRRQNHSSLEPPPKLPLGSHSLKGAYVYLSHLGWCRKPARCHRQSVFWFCQRIQKGNITNEHVGETKRRQRFFMRSFPTCIAQISNVSSTARIMCYM
jgi:hypothetical protein